MYSKILKPIVHSPILPELIKELQEIWEQEQERREEFYEWVTPDMKAEFIEGEIIIHSPVKSVHNEVLLNLVMLVNFYVKKHNLGYVGLEKIMVRFSRNDYEPDLCFFKSSLSKEFKDDQTLFPVPHFIVEVLSPGTEERDRGVKFEDYALHGVEEYWIIDPGIQVVECYHLDGKKYKLAQKVEDGQLEFKIIEGLTIPFNALFDHSANLEALQKL